VAQEFSSGDIAGAMSSPNTLIATAQNIDSQSLDRNTAKESHWADQKERLRCWEHGCENFPAARTLYGIRRKNQARGNLILAGTVEQCLAGQQLATITLQIIAVKEFGGTRTVGKDRGFGQGLGRTVTIMVVERVSFTFIF